MKKLIAMLTLMGGFILSFSILADSAKITDKPSPPNVPDSTEASDVNAVFVFNRVCYGQVPNIEGIIKMSDELGWSPLSTEELEQLSPASESDKTFGWDTPIGERAFRVTLVQGIVAPKIIDTFPDFKNGQSTSCTLVLDGRDQGEELLEQLGKLAGKEPASKDVFKDGLYTTTWAGGNAKVKVFLIAKTDEMKLGTLISVVMLTR